MQRIEGTGAVATRGEGMRRMRHAERDPSLTARITAVVPLLYSAGGDAGEDRPAHVRASSSITAIDGHLIVVQDDARFIGRIDLRTMTVRAVMLPRGEDGARQFDDGRGNRHLKLDLEACVLVREEGDPILFAFGSGSSPEREVVVIAPVEGGREARLVAVPDLYAALRADPSFSGSELNVEGAVLVGDRLRLFNRGNGAPLGGRRGVDATAEVSWRTLREHLEDPARAVPPRPERVVGYTLGDLGGVRLTFTDATPWGEAILYTAAAERSPDALQDGPVEGSAIGVIAEERVFWAPLLGPGGEVCRSKVEGIALDTTDPSAVYVVVDHDDPTVPSDLCRVVLTGPWASAKFL